MKLTFVKLTFLRPSKIREMKTEKPWVVRPPSGPMAKGLSIFEKSGRQNVRTRVTR